MCVDVLDTSYCKVLSRSLSTFERRSFFISYCFSALLCVQKASQAVEENEVNEM